MTERSRACSRPVGWPGNYKIVCCEAASSQPTFLFCKAVQTSLSSHSRGNGAIPFGLAAGY